MREQLRDERKDEETTRVTTTKLNTNDSDNKGRTKHTQQHKVQMQLIHLLGYGNIDCHVVNPKMVALPVYVQIEHWCSSCSCHNISLKKTFSCNSTTNQLR